MTIGPGKYDKECAFVFDVTGAAAVLLIVIGGRKGNGFSGIGDAQLMSSTPNLLRQMADQIEADAPPPVSRSALWPAGDNFDGD